MYDTGATIGENMSKDEKVTAHDQSKVLTSAPKNRISPRVAGDTPIQDYCRHPHRIRRRLMYDTCETMSENMSEIENVTAHDRTKVLTSSIKNRLTTQAAGPTPLQSYFRDPLRIRRRLMYDTGAKIG